MSRAASASSMAARVTPLSKRFQLAATPAFQLWLSRPSGSKFWLSPVPAERLTDGRSPAFASLTASSFCWSV